MIYALFPADNAANNVGPVVQEQMLLKIFLI